MTQTLYAHMNKRNFKKVNVLILSDQVKMMFFGRQDVLCGNWVVLWEKVIEHPKHSTDSMYHNFSL
jgi:hypothetical protein